MEDSLRFDNKVVVVTGAGSGLGHAYAIEFAKRGAKLLVNDLGGSRKGEGTSHNAADSVVEEIKKIGGQAVANYDSVEFGDKIIKSALDAFGRVDVVLNNAGILRDKTILKMTSADWDLIMNVHLKGAYSVTKAAWRAMKTNKYGRIINTSSGSGLYGNFGQSNYATAKLGLHGFTQTLAIEGEKYNIKVNSIVPVAASRMTEDVLSKELLDIFVPEKIVPLVVYLAHESCEETGGLFEVAGGWFTKLRWQRAQGLFLNGAITAEQIKKDWEKVVSFEGNNDYPTKPPDTVARIIKYIEDNKPKL